MPEGDTIFRAARALRSWISGRVVTSCTSRDAALGAGRLVGRTIGEISTHGKHLFVEFLAASDSEPTLVLRTHMMMTGSWHTYTEGQQWRRPIRQAVLTIVAGDRVAVCFNAPVVELTSTRDALRNRLRADIGPDILGSPLDHPEIGRRWQRVDPKVTVGEVLLDQHVVAGIGNIFRCETLFLTGTNPFTPIGAISVEKREGIFERAAKIMRASVVPGSTRSFGASDTRPWVYGRSGRPCQRCNRLVQSRRHGTNARTVYWCDTCQPPTRV